MTKFKKLTTGLYGASALVSLTLAALSYRQLCPTNSNPCFKIWVANACMMLACVGFIPMYGVRAWFGSLDQQRHTSGSWRLRVAQVLHVAGATLVWAAVGWFVGGSVRSFV